MGMLLRHRYTIQGLSVPMQISAKLRGAGIDTLAQVREASEEQLERAGLDANERTTLARALNPRIGDGRKIGDGSDIPPR